jgi:hypothetical protein
MECQRFDEDECPKAAFDSDDEDDEASKQLTEDIKSRLFHSLGKLPSAMSFASSNPCPTEVNPGICINGIGRIGLPLSERDAELILKSSHTGSHRKESDIMVNPTFELLNPKWDMALKEVVGLAVMDLGVFCEVKAELYKMLLYGQGAMFKEHRKSVFRYIIKNVWIIADELSHLSSPKHPDTFGTLVICLSSKHEGGEMTVTHGGKEKILKTADSSEFGYTYLCWFVAVFPVCCLLKTKIYSYKDVKHKIAPVTSGYRLVLIYNLIYTDPQNPIKTPVDFDTQMKELGNVLTSWRDNFSRLACPALAYTLEHRYSEPSLSPSSPKGADSFRMQCLIELCEEHGFDLFLAELEDDEKAWQEMYLRVYDEEPETTDIESELLILKDIVDLDGKLLFDAVPFSKSLIIQENAEEGIAATHRRTVSPNCFKSLYYLKF